MHVVGLEVIPGSIGRGMGKWEREEKERNIGCIHEQDVSVNKWGALLWGYSGRLGKTFQSVSYKGCSSWGITRQHPSITGRGWLYGMEPLARSPTPGQAELAPGIRGSPQAGSHGVCRESDPVYRVLESAGTVNCEL